MLRITLCLLMGVLVWGFASSSKCPDGSACSDHTTCCKTDSGYKCCPYPNAVCCADLAHCCPSSFRCNMLTQMCDKEDQPWMSTPMVKNEAAEKPSSLVPPQSLLQELKNNQVPEQERSSVIYCDSYNYCPDGTTCCRHPKGAWFCCPFSIGHCCLDGYHCCPFGYDCDLTYTHCVRQNLRYPFILKQAPSSVPASPISPPESEAKPQKTPMTALTEASGGTTKDGVIRCDSRFYCPQGSSCCKDLTGQWSCCPYPLGQCCKDGKHCCQYGYTCDPSSTSCRKFYSQVPSGSREHAQTV